MLRVQFLPPVSGFVAVILLQVKAAREKEAAQKGKATGAASQTLQLQMP